MFIQDWDSFAEQAEALYKADPICTRYTLKYRHCDGKAVLKVTDDKVVSCSESMLFPVGSQRARLPFRSHLPLEDSSCMQDLLLYTAMLRPSGTAVQDRPAGRCAEI